MQIGILAFHGDVAEHAAIVASLGHETVEVRTVADLAPVTHLILPGGESTVIGHFLSLTGVGRAIVDRARSGSLSILATCAGAILLARTVKGARPPRSLGLMDITIARNAYGTQANSFAAQIAVKGISRPLNVAFIRAPKILTVGRGAEVLASYDDSPVVVRQGRLWALTCHPELCGETAIHERWLGE